MTIPADTIEAAAASLFGNTARVDSVSPLAGDASTRRYFRISFAPGSPARSMIAMLYPDDTRPGDELPFVNVHRYFRAAGIPVPDILLHLADKKLLFLSDLGDKMLEDVADSSSGFDEVLPQYERCVEILVRIQWDGTLALDSNALPSRLSFDMSKFSEEIDFFFSHAVREYGGIALSPEQERAMEDRFLPFLERLVSLPNVLVHRDYHSRNVMVREALVPGEPPELFVLDFQDARMGNVFYDLCSLLRDSYVTLPENAVRQLCYVWRNAATHSLRKQAGDPNAFAYLLDLAALQRNVKAIGTFGNQIANRGKELYRKFIPPTVAHLARNFDRNPEMRHLSSMLMPILAALSEKAEKEMTQCGE